MIKGLITSMKLEGNKQFLTIELSLSSAPLSRGISTYKGLRNRISDIEQLRLGEVEIRQEPYKTEDE